MRHKVRHLDNIITHIIVKHSERRTPERGVARAIPIILCRASNGCNLSVNTNIDTPMRARAAFKGPKEIYWAAPSLCFCYV